jgi:nucleolar protein 58
MVATKAALSIRVDALTNLDGKSEPVDVSASIGIENRAKLESRLRALEHQGDLSGVRRFADNGKKQAKFEMGGETKTYNTQADAVDLVSTQREDPMTIAVKAVLDVKEEKKRAKEERRAKKRAEKEKTAEVADVSMDVDGDEDEEKKAKKDKKRKRRESEAVNGDTPEVEPKKVRALFRKLFKTDVDRRRRKRRRNVKQGRRRGKPRKQQQRQTGIQSHRRKRRRKSRRPNLCILSLCSIYGHIYCYIFHRVSI